MRQRPFRQIGFSILVFVILLFYLGEARRVLASDLLIEAAESGTSFRTAIIDISNPSYDVNMAAISEFTVFAGVRSNWRFAREVDGLRHCGIKLRIASETIGGLHRVSFWQVPEFRPYGLTMALYDSCGCFSDIHNVERSDYRMPFLNQIDPRPNAGRHWVYQRNIPNTQSRPVRRYEFISGQGDGFIGGSPQRERKCGDGDCSESSDCNGNGLNMVADPHPNSRERAESQGKVFFWTFIICGVSMVLIYCYSCRDKE